MARRLIKFLALLVVIVILAVPITALLLDDETFSAWLGEFSVPAKNTEALLKQKRSIGITLGEYVSDAFGGLETFYFAVMGHSAPQKPMRVASRGSKQVVIDLPLPPPSAGPSPPSPKPAIIPSPPPPQIKARKKQPAIAPSGTAPGAVPPKMVAKKPVAKKSVVKEREATPPPATKTARLPPTNNPPRKIDPTADQDHKRGLLFYKGIGVDKDFKKAAQWFRRAANKGHAGAQYNLGIMSYLGQGMDQDYAQAAHWFHKAGEQDHAAAQYNLGFLYYEGKGVEKDSLQAFMWIDRSANLGDEKAIRARDTLQKALPREIFNR